MLFFSRCIDNTDGPHCERCKSGFFGDALAIKRPGDPEKCQTCQCNPLGTNLNEHTQLPLCHDQTGQCSCKHHVRGKNCDVCEDGYYNLMSNQASVTIKL